MGFGSLNSALEANGTVRIVSKENWGSGSVYLRGRTWWISYPFNGQQVKESSGLQDKAKAQKILTDRMTKINKGQFAGIQAEHIAVDELLDDLLEDYKENGKSYDWAELVVRCHLRPFFGYYRAALVGTELIKRYVRHRRQEGLTSKRKRPTQNGTINRELALLRRAFKLGAKHEPPKVARVPFIAELEERNVRKGFFLREDFQRVLSELPEDVRPVALFAYYTGCRRGEILRLQWNQFDQGARVLRLEPDETKNREPRTVPLPEELFASLLNVKAERDENWPRCPWIFTRAGTRIKDFRASWEAACGRAQIGNGANLFHDLRRTGVRNLVRAGVPETVAMRISGHKTRAVFDRYNITSDEDLQEAAQKVTEYLKGKKGDKQ